MQPIRTRLAVTLTASGLVLLAALVAAPLLGSTSISLSRVFDRSIPFADNTDAQIFFARFPELPEEDDARLVRVRGRKLPDSEFVLRFERDTVDYSWIMEGSASRYYPEIRELERKWPANPFTAKEVTSELGWARTSAYRVLHRLQYTGVLRKNGAGWMWDPMTPFGTKNRYTTE